MVRAKVVPSCDLLGDGQPLFVCMLSTKHLQFVFFSSMDISNEKVLDFFFASPFSLLCSIFCSSKPECPKKCHLALNALLESCPSLSFFNRSAKPQKGNFLCVFWKTLAQKSSQTPEKRSQKSFVTKKHEEVFQIQAPHGDFSQCILWICSIYKVA